MAYYAEGGRSYGAVAQHLNAHPSGYRWRDRKDEPVPFDKYAVRSIISNVLIYAGWVPVGRGKDMRIKDEAKDLRELVKLTDAVSGQHPPLVDEELANRVLAARHERLKLVGRRKAHVYLLTPVLYCADCGEPLRGKRLYPGGTRHRYAHRENALERIKAAGLDPLAVEGSHNADTVEERALSVPVLELPHTALNDLCGVVAERVATRPENEAVRNQLAKLDRRKDRLRDLYLLEDYTRDAYLVLRNDLERQIGELERQLGGAAYLVEAVLARITNPNSVMCEGTREQQKRAIRLLFRKISVGLDGEIRQVEPRP